MAREGTGSNTSEILVFPYFLFPLSLSLLFVPLSFSVTRKEARRGWRIMRKDVGVCKGDPQL
jgi:predicted acyltransferase